MLNKEVCDIVEARLKRTRELLVVKGSEYVRGDDRLCNFKRAAAFAKTTPEDALLGVMNKHLISISDMIIDTREGRTNSPEMWSEKIGDAVVYLCLLECLVLERLGVRAEHERYPDSMPELDLMKGRSRGT